LLFLTTVFLLGMCGAQGMLLFFSQSAEKVPKIFFSGIVAFVECNRLQLPGMKFVEASTNK
jgi:hypothetical protein